MARYAVRLCDPGSSLARDRHTPEELVGRCRCRHARHYHWAGGGACGECGCEYFRLKPSTGTPTDGNVTP